MMFSRSAQDARRGAKQKRDSADLAATSESVVREFRNRLSAPILVTLLICAAPLVQAHAILLSSTPAAKAVVDGPDLTVSLKYNSRIDAKRSRLTLVAASGEEQTLVIARQSSPDVLEAPAKGLQSGAYILRWQVLAVDGHVTRGEVPFSVR